MSAFTDDDLRRVKAKLKGASETIDFDLPALLARLEAAELFAEIASQQTHHCFSALGDTCKFEITLKAWRKAAGKK